MRAAPAAAVVATTLVVLAACGDGQVPPTQPGGGAMSSQSRATSVPPSATEPSTTATATEQSTTATEPSEQPSEDPADQGAAIAVVLEWLEAAQSGDTDALADLTGEFSVRGAEEFGGLAEASTGLAEGMGAFADTQDARWSAVEIPSQPASWIVVVEGTVTREGMTERDARSWVVHPEGDRGLVVEGFAPSPPEVVSPPQGSRDLAPGVPVEVYLGAGNGSGTVLLDGAPIAEGIDVAAVDGDQIRVTALPPGGWPAGAHTVTVASVPGDDAGPGAPWTSVAVPVVVA